MSKEPETNRSSLENTDKVREPLDIENIVKQAKLEGLEFEAADNSRVGNAPVLDNGLNLLYAPQSYGKSYTSVKIAVESNLPSVFVDLESNGKSFVDYCKKHNVAYVYAGNAENILDTIKNLVQALNTSYGKIFIIIDSYSDLFPDDEGKMAQAAQKKLGELHKFFMREAKMPVLLLDHATELRNGEGLVHGFKVEGNKSGKYKKTVAVLCLDQIDGDIKNGTYLTVKRSRNQDVLPVGYTQYYRRNDYLVKKILGKIDEGKLSKEFMTKDLENILSGDDRKMWRDLREEITTQQTKNGKKFWKLKSENQRGKGTIEG